MDMSVDVSSRGPSCLLGSWLLFNVPFSRFSHKVLIVQLIHAGSGVLIAFTFFYVSGQFMKTLEDAALSVHHLLQQPSLFWLMLAVSYLACPMTGGFQALSCSRRMQPLNWDKHGTFSQLAVA